MDLRRHVTQRRSAEPAQACRAPEERDIPSVSHVVLCPRIDGIQLYHALPQHTGTANAHARQPVASPTQLTPIVHGQHAPHNRTYIEELVTCIVSVTYCIRCVLNHLLRIPELVVPSAHSAAAVLYTYPGSPRGRTCSKRILDRI